MKKQFTLSVANPCSENWNNFTPTLSGGFCQSCSKNVVDFTKMSEKEIIEFFGKQPINTCGRFHPNQLSAAFKVRVSVNVDFFVITILKLSIYFQLSIS